MPAEAVVKKKQPKVKPIRISGGNLPERIREILDTPHRCYIAPKQENTKLLIQLLELGYISSSPRRGVRKYRCRYAPAWLPTCPFTAAQSGSDIVRHLGTHANQEQHLINGGALDIESAAMLN